VTLCKIRGSLDGNREDYCALACDAVYLLR